jgi:hypothetical protein
MKREEMKEKNHKKDVHKLFITPTSSKINPSAPALS